MQRPADFFVLYKLAFRCNLNSSCQCKIGLLFFFLNFTCLDFPAVDPVCGRTRLCHWPGEDVPFLLPEAQDEGHQLLPRWRFHRADRLAHCRRRAGDLRLFPLV